MKYLHAISAPLVCALKQCRRRPASPDLLALPGSAARLLRTQRRPPRSTVTATAGASLTIVIRIQRGEFVDFDFLLEVTTPLPSPTPPSFSSLYLDPYRRSPPAGRTLLGARCSDDRHMRMQHQQQVNLTVLYGPFSIMSREVSSGTSISCCPIQLQSVQLRRHSNSVAPHMLLFWCTSAYLYPNPDLCFVGCMTVALVLS